MAVNVMKVGYTHITRQLCVYFVKDWTRNWPKVYDHSSVCSVINVSDTMLLFGA